MPSPFEQSIYNILTPLDGRSTLVYNSFSGALALFDSRDLSIYEAIAQGEAVTDPSVSGRLGGGNSLEQPVQESRRPISRPNVAMRTRLGISAQSISPRSDEFVPVRALVIAPRASPVG